MSELETGIRGLFAEVDALAAAEDLWARAIAWQPARPAPRARRMPVFAVAAVVVLVVVAGLLVRGMSFGAGSTVSAAQAAERACRGSGPPQACFQALARVAAESPDNSRFVYQRVLIADTAPLRLLPPGYPKPPYYAWTDTVHLATATRPFTVESFQRREIWIDKKTYRGVSRVSKPHLIFPTRQDREAWIAAGSPSWKAMNQDTEGRRIIKPGVRRVSDTEWLYYYDLTQVRHKTGVAHPGRVLPTTVAGVEAFPLPWYPFPLADPTLTPGQRAAILRVAAIRNIGPGANKLGSLVDPVGDRGAAIVEGFAGGRRFGRDVILYDTRTGRELAWGNVANGYHARKSRNIVWLRIYPVPAAPANGLPAVPPER